MLGYDKKNWAAATERRVTVVLKGTRLLHNSHAGIIHKERREAFVKKGSTSALWEDKGL